MLCPTTTVEICHPNYVTIILRFIHFRWYHIIQGYEYDKQPYD